MPIINPIIKPFFRLFIPTKYEIRSEIKLVIRSDILFNKGCTIRKHNPNINIALHITYPILNNFFRSK